MSEGVLIKIHEHGYLYYQFIFILNVCLVLVFGCICFENNFYTFKKKIKTVGCLCLFCVWYFLNL
jgi:hypothetical protein